MTCVCYRQVCTRAKHSTAQHTTARSATTRTSNVCKASDHILKRRPPLLSRSLVCCVLGVSWRFVANVCLAV